MVQRAVLWGSVVLVGALLGVSAPWSRALQPCEEVAAAERERMRLAGRCEGRAPIVEARPAGARGAPRAGRRPVPDLRGRPFNVRDERLGRFLVAVDYRPSAQRRDWVIDQVPRPPASLPDGGDLRVVLSDGALVRVPDVRGSFARALAVLYRAGLSWSTDDASPGSVVAQVPAPGAAVNPGTPITLRLAGPGPIALAPESTKPAVGPVPPPATTPPTTAPSTTPSAPPVNATPAPTAPRSPSPTPSSPAAPSMTMPDLQGLNFDVARARLAGFTVNRVHRAGTEAGGTVIGQSPAAGTRLAPGTAVRLVLSDGSLVRVPRVRSFTLDEARQRLVSGELRPVIANVPNEAPAGTVISQQPAENQIAQRGSTVRLNVSSGPAARPSVKVPTLVGSTLERARTRLGRLQVERSERAAREPVGTILEQTPAPGTEVEPGSTVSVVVSSGGRPEVIDMTNVVGQGMDAATSALSEFRLERETVPSAEPAGRVLSQDPPPGAPVPPGSTVRLRVSDGSRVVAPSLAQMTVAQARETARAAGLAVELGDGARDDSRVTGQDPPPGAEILRGSALRLTVEARALPFEAPPAVRDAWAQAADFVRQQSPRNFAIAAVVLLALLALLLVARRRARGPYVPVDPVFAPTPPRTAGPPPAVSPPAATTSAAPPASAPVPAPAAPAPIPAAEVPAVVKRRKAVPPPAVAAPPPAPEPVIYNAVARLESDAAQTVATNAAPRGPEIRIGAHLEPGAGSVRELPAETAPDELTEETK